MRSQRSQKFAAILGGVMIVPLTAGPVLGSETPRSQGTSAPQKQSRTLSPVQKKAARPGQPMTPRLPSPAGSERGPVLSVPLGNAAPPKAGSWVRMPALPKVGTGSPSTPIPLNKPVGVQSTTSGTGLQGSAITAPAPPKIGSAPAPALQNTLRAARLQRQLPTQIPISWGNASVSTPYQCTDYVKAVRPDLKGMHGDAATWLDHAATMDYGTSKGPNSPIVPGSVVVMQSSNPNTIIGKYGHVGVVKGTVTQNGKQYLAIESANFATINGIKPNLGSGTPPAQSLISVNDPRIRGYIYTKQ